MTSEPTSPTLFEQCHGFFYVRFQLKYKDEGDKANGLTSPPNDAIIWTEKGSEFHSQHDLTSCFQRRWLMVRPGFELTTSCSADRRSSNWGNRTAVTFGKCFSMFVCIRAGLRFTLIGGRLSQRGATGELEVEFKFQRRSCKLPLLFLSLPERPGELARRLTNRPDSNISYF